MGEAESSILYKESKIKKYHLDLVRRMGSYDNSFEHRIVEATDMQCNESAMLFFDKHKDIVAIYPFAHAILVKIEKL